MPPCLAFISKILPGSWLLHLTTTHHLLDLLGLPVLLLPTPQDGQLCPEHPLLGRLFALLFLSNSMHTFLLPLFSGYQWNGPLAHTSPCFYPVRLSSLPATALSVQGISLGWENRT